MYEKPSLTRIGSFREVTRGGTFGGVFDNAADNYFELFFTGSPTTS